MCNTKNVGFLIWVDGSYVDIYSRVENAEAHADLTKHMNQKSLVEVQEVRSEVGVVVYLSATPSIPINGVIDHLGRVRVGAAGGWEFSRYLTDIEIRRITKRS